MPQRCRDTLRLACWYVTSLTVHCKTPSLRICLPIFSNNPSPKKYRCYTTTGGVLFDISFTLRVSIDCQILEIIVLVDHDLE